MAAPLSFDQRIKALEKSTPTASEPRVTRSAHASKEIPEWHDELSAAANAISPSLFDAETLRYRAELQSYVKRTPESPEAWQAYLSLLNNERKRHATPETANNMHATLVALYDRATSIIPLIRVNRHSEIYLDIWLDLAYLRAEDAEDDYLARETFKYMKRECIGLAYPKFWYAWADLEARLGNHDKSEEHRRKGRTRESGGTPASTAKPPNPVTRRPLRPPRRANDTHNENQSNIFAADTKATDSSTEMKTPVTSTATRAGRVLTSADRNRQSPTLSNWTPAMRENPSPLVNSTPEPTLVRPTDTSALDSLSKYYALKRDTKGLVGSNETAKATETQPAETPSSQLASQTPPVRREVRNTGGSNRITSLSHRTSPSRETHGHNVRENNFSASLSRPAPMTHDPPIRSVFDVLGTAPRSQESQDNARASKSASFEDGSRNEQQVSAQKRWNSTIRQPSSVVKSSPPPSSVSGPRSPEVPSPEVLRSSQTRREHRPTPTLFSPREHPGVKENVNHFVTEKQRGYDALGREEAVSLKENQIHKASDTEGRQGEFSSSLTAEKRERQDQIEGDRMEESRYSKRKPGTPAQLSRNVRVGKPSAQKRDTEEQSPLPRVTPPHQFPRQSDSSSSATPATERIRFRQRVQSPRQRSFLTELGPERYVTVNGKQYLILEQVGKGGSSKVYKVLNDHMRIMALKRVRVQMTSTYMVTLNSYANEIALLKQLRGAPNIVQLYDAEVKTEMGLISLIMEYGDIDLAKRLGKTDRNSKINGNFRRLYWNQMLEAVHTIHEARIVHGDLKPANFLIVAGTLKLIDFGIAKAIQTEDTTKIVRDSQQGTPNYMSPEALMAEGDEYFDDDNYGESSYGRSHKSQYRVGRASDIWSLGCILYQMACGRTPFAHIKNVLTKLSCIQDPNHEISYRSIDEPLVADVLKGCLQRDPTKRMSIPQLLNHPYLNSGQEKAVDDGSSSDLTAQIAGDSRVLVRSVCEAAERCGYCMTSFSGEKITMRNGDRNYERMIDMVSRKVTVPPISMGQWDNGHTQGRDRSFGLKNQILTPTTSAITNQASRTGLTGSKVRTGTLNGNRTDTKTGERL